MERYFDKVLFKNERPVVFRTDRIANDTENVRSIVLKKYVIVKILFRSHSLKERPWNSGPIIHLFSPSEMKQFHLDPSPKKQTKNEETKKKDRNLCITLYPCERSRQNHLVYIICQKKCSSLVSATENGKLPFLYT